MQYILSSQPTTVTRNYMNPHLGTDVLKYLDSVISDTPEMQLIALTEAMRIQLNQVLIDARSSSQMMQELPNSSSK